MPRTREQDREYQRMRRARKAAGGAAAAPADPETSTVPPKKEKESREHRNAVTRLLRATGLAHVPEEAPLVALVKDLAREMDVSPSASTSSRYRMALADVRRVLNGSERRVSAPVDRSKPEPDESSEPSNVSTLATFKASKGIA